MKPFNFQYEFISDAERISRKEPVAAFCTSAGDFERIDRGGLERKKIMEGIRSHFQGVIPATVFSEYGYCYEMPLFRRDI